MNIKALKELYMMFLFKLFGLKGRRKFLFDCDKMLK